MSDYQITVSFRDELMFTVIPSKDHTMPDCRELAQQLRDRFPSNNVKLFRTGFTPVLLIS